MRKIYTFVLISVILAVFTACKDHDDEKSDLRINDGATFLSLDAAARSGDLRVTAANGWHITPPVADWITLDRLHGSAGTTTLHVTFAANDGAARSHVLQFVCGGRTYPFTLSQSAAHTGFDAPEYAFYVTFGTMPTLYAGLYLLTDERPSWVFYERSKTFKSAEFPTHASVLVPADRTANATDREVTQAVDALKRRILEINAEDPTAVYGLYVDDLRCRLGYDWFVAQGIDSARVKVTLLSDGTATYNNYAAYFGDPATAVQNWETYAAEVEALDWNHGGRYPQTRLPAGLDAFTWAYYMASLPDYRLVLQNKSLIEGAAAFDAVYLPRIHFEEVQPYDLLTNLSADRRAQFFRMAGFDYDSFAAQFDASAKPNLIILGTNPEGDAGKAQQQAYVAQVVARYGAQYDLFFKPHPADTSSADYPTLFPDMTLLPGQMPFEIFVWSLLNKIDVIGGYPSTTLLTVPLSKVKFLFAPDAASLVRPLNLLFRNATDVEWMNLN